MKVSGSLCREALERGRTNGERTNDLPLKKVLDTIVSSGSVWGE